MLLGSATGVQQESGFALSLPSRIPSTRTRHASSSQAASAKRTFHVLITPDISCANDKLKSFWIQKR